tara:strand:- start:1974 stop:2945 length:972 start_codon:yes stop_codon:yes gene_type:complete
MKDCKLKIEPFKWWKHHYFGWHKTIDFLRSKIESTSQNAILFEPSVEATFVNGNTKDLERIKMYENNKWVGVFHHPHNDSRNYHHIYDLITKHKQFKQCFKNLVGIFVVCQEQKIHYEQIPELKELPISVLYHPTDMNVPQFDFDSFYNNTDRDIPCGNIMVIGDHLRLHRRFYKLSTEYKKSVLLSQEDDWMNRDQKRNEQLKIHGIIKYEKNIRNDDYDKVLCNNIQFVDLKNPTASNLIIECMARCTPICVNNHPSIIDYIGNDYPLIYDNIRKLSRKLRQKNILEKASDYMLNSDHRKKIAPEYFVESFFNSEVYKSLK